VAIDPSDARDHDDAIWAEPDGAGGFRALVAIADVSFYVRPGGQLDRDARKRGNSVYFPDRVVPMLPEVLSADVCSLRSGRIARHGLPPDIAADGRIRISASPARWCASTK
jgi:ribonuclease R